jgi:hypothetical protein
VRLTVVRPVWASLVLVSVIVALQAAGAADHDFHANLIRHFALNWETLSKFELHRVALSPLVQTRPGFTPTVVVLVVIVLPLCELRTDHLRTLAAFFGGDWVSTLLVLLVWKIAGELGSASAAAQAARLDSGSSSGGFGCLAVVCVTLPSWLRLASLAGLAVYFAVRFIGWEAPSDYQHLVATFAGLALGLVWRRPRHRSPPPATVPPPCSGGASK